MSTQAEPRDVALDLGLGRDAPAPSAMAREQACATGIAETQALPAVLELVIDTSASMAWPPGWEPTSKEPPPFGVASKWEITREALTRAVGKLPSSTHLGVNFYPNVAHSSDRCTKNEAALALGSLGDRGSAQRKRFEQALAAALPRGGTPTHSAYRYGLDLVAKGAAQGAAFILLITDGAPNYTLNCGGDGFAQVDSAPLVAEAQAALARGIRTFVIGSPGSEPARSALSRVAEAGGTATPDCSHEGPSYCHFDMTKKDDLGAALADALSDIRTELTSCEYTVPNPPPGQTLDPERVNVVTTSGDGEIRVLTRVSEPDCRDGWRYSRDRRRIVLCERSCGEVRRDPESRVDVLFGCESERAR